MCAGVGCGGRFPRFRKVPVCAGVGSKGFRRVPVCAGVGSGGRFRRQVSDAKSGKRRVWFNALQP